MSETFPCDCGNSETHTLDCNSMRKPVAEEAAVVEEVVDDEPFTLEKGKERAVEAVDRVKQAGKEVTTRPILDAIGSYFTRGVDALIGLAEGIEGKARKKGQK